MTLYIVCRTSITQSMFFSTGLKEKKRGGGAFLSLLSYIPRIQNLRRGIWLNVMLWAGSLEHLQTQWGQASLVGIICPLIVIGLIYLTKVEIRQPTIYYAGLLGLWNKWIIDRESDVPSIIFFYTFYRLRAFKTLYFYFCNFIRK